ncbi:MAG: XrtA-associated ATPase [Gammaproteobacteria bacterium]|jgi:general secretion pathway protein A|nr:XrtA-associated ATPase [Gammaproteobacteria bacterium]MBU2178483.1 XrtA-associated ATPase [Gammaproteobacteria bacterium]MBU2223797.1 XrtA-associated ATPase [Gammaproteobacteria bacterium]MBU2310062.1 XrtA-associated ATPase [Alphaproteobacteria bacterium]MBU2426914.1 XrtA-associated ATPase [Gammaproteobacteria bacterium]
MYESYYGFHERPFQLTPNPQWFFASKLHKRALAYLQYGLSQGEGFIVITGDVGTGKTTIANQLLARLDQQIVARQIVTSRLGPDDLLRMIASVFSLSVKDNNKTAYIEAISHYLTQLHSQHKRALLLVDEAQNLPLESIEELRMLSNFQIGGKPLLQSFLLGQNELNAIIQSPHMEQFRQRIIASSNLSSLSEEDCQAYIEYRITQAGVSRPLLDKNCFASIYRFTNGIPRKINNLMDRILLFGFLEDKTLINQTDVEEVIIEISGEVAQRQPSPQMSVQTTVANNVPPQDVVVQDAVTNTAPSNPYHAMLAELSGLLDSSLEHKIKMAKELDTLLNQQHKQVMKKLEDDKGS